MNRSVAKGIVLVALIVLFSALAAGSRGEEGTATQAEQGDAAAQYALGTRYKEGQGVAQDYREAVKWYTRSAEQGHADAQVILGAMHYAGLGVEKDKAMAFAWWTKAARQGNEAAQKSLTMLCAESPELCR